MYGLRITGANGEQKLVTPDDGTVISAGSVSMPNSLKGDNTYGVDIDLGGTFDEDEISVLVVPRRPFVNTVYQRFISGGTLYYNTFYLDSAKTYYSRNENSGVMTSFSGGSRSSGQLSTWNPVLSVFPIAFWDKMGQSSFSNIRLFAATGYLYRSLQNLENYAYTEGSASKASGSIEWGSPSDINDNNNSTYCGTWAFSNTFGGIETRTLVLDITFPEKDLTHIQNYWGYGSYAGGSADGYSKIYVKTNNGSWVLVGWFSWGGTIPFTMRTDNIYGFWKKATGVRWSTRCHAERSGWNGSQSRSACYELRAFGIDRSNADGNKIAYSIGSNGIETVDYMICRKKYLV